MSADREELYICRPPARLWVSILVQLSAFNNDITEESDIEIAVLWLKVRRTGGPSGMHTKDLKKWRQEAKQKKDPEERRWEPVARLVHVMFRDGDVL